MKITIALLSLLLLVPNPLAGQVNPPPIAASKKVPQSVPVKKAKAPETPDKTLTINGVAAEGKLLRVGDSYYISIDDLAKTVSGSVSYSDTKISLTISSTSSGQDNHTLQGSGAVSVVHNNVAGRIFAVTNGGDLVSARFAKVGLLQGEAATKFETGGFPAAPDNFLQSLGINNPLIEQQQQLKTLQSMLNVYQRFIDVQEQHPDLVTSVASDEEGHFQFQDVKAGHYSIAAFGRAGQNAAIWVAQIEVEADKTLEIKLSTPRSACRDPNNYFQF